MLIAVIISVLVLYIAPLFGKQLQRQVDWRQAMDGFVVVSVLGIIAFNIMPAVLESKIPYIPFIFLAGLALPNAVEVLLKGREIGTHRLALYIPAFAMIIHSLGDGSILRLIDGEPQAQGVALSMILHRFGLGAAIWWMMINQEGRRAGLIFVTIMAVATLLGYGSTNLLLKIIAVPEIELVQAFAAGSLLHIILHPLDHEALERGRGRGRHKFGSFLGGLLILSIFALHIVGHTIPEQDLVSLHDREHADAFDRLISFGATISPLLFALIFTAHLSVRLRFLAPLSLVLWLTLFAFIPVSYFPDFSIGRYMLEIYGLILIFFITRFGGRTTVGYLLPKSLTDHPHRHHH